MRNNKIVFWLLVIVLVCSSVFAATPNIQVSLLNQDPDPAKAGDVVELRLRVQNTGDAEAKDLWVEAVPDYPFVLMSEGKDSKQVIDSLPNYPEKESATTLMFKFRINRDATEGQYSIKFRHSLNKGTAWFMHEFNIDLTSREYAQIFSIDKVKIMPGKETDLTFTITNVGNAPLQNMVFFWKEPNGIILPVGTDNTRYIKYLDPGQAIPLKYNVIASVNAKPDLYTLSLNLQYDTKAQNGSNTKETITTTSGVFVGGETDFDVAFSESTQGQTSLSVANVGSNPAFSVTVRIPQQEGFSVRGTTDSIIGNLDKGDYTIVSFQITQGSGFSGTNAAGTRANGANADAGSANNQQQARQRFAQRNMSQSPQSNTLKALIDYTDTTGVRHTIEKNVAIQFRPVDSTGTTTQYGKMRQASSSSTWLFLLVIIVIVASIILHDKPELREKILSRLRKKDAA